MKIYKFTENKYTFLYKDSTELQVTPFSSLSLPTF